MMLTVMVIVIVVDVDDGFNNSDDGLMMMTSLTAIMTRMTIVDFVYGDVDSSGDKLRTTLNFVVYDVDLIMIFTMIIMIFTVMTKVTVYVIRRFPFNSLVRLQVGIIELSLVSFL